MIVSQLIDPGVCLEEGGEDWEEGGEEEGEGEDREGGEEEEGEGEDRGEGGGGEREEEVERRGEGEDFLLCSKFQQDREVSEHNTDEVVGVSQLQPTVTQMVS